MPGYDYHREYFDEGKVWLIIAASLVLIGGILFAGVMSTLRWDFMKLSTVKYETNTYEISEAFDGISMNTETADIVLRVLLQALCLRIRYLLHKPIQEILK